MADSRAPGQGGGERGAQELASAACDHEAAGKRALGDDGEGKRDGAASRTVESPIRAQVPRTGEKIAEDEGARAASARKQPSSAKESASAATIDAAATASTARRALLRVVLRLVRHVLVRRVAPAFQIAVLRVVAVFRRIFGAPAGSDGAHVAVLGSVGAHARRVHARNRRHRRKRVWRCRLLVRRRLTAASPPFLRPSARFIFLLAVVVVARAFRRISDRQILRHADVGLVDKLREIVRQRLAELERTARTDVLFHRSCLLLRNFHTFNVIPFWVVKWFDVSRRDRKEEKLYNNKIANKKSTHQSSQTSHAT